MVRPEAQAAVAGLDAVQDAVDVKVAPAEAMLLLLSVQAPLVLPVLGTSLPPQPTAGGATTIAPHISVSLSVKHKTTCFLHMPRHAEKHFAANCLIT